MTEGVMTYRVRCCFVFMVGQVLTCLCDGELDADMAEVLKQDGPTLTGFQRLALVLKVLGDHNYGPALPPTTTEPNTTILAFARTDWVQAK
jgi:hypothetical protein